MTGNAKVGNLYVNRNMVGAVVGVQPFGGEGLSGTGPKAGGPLYLYRLLANRPENALGVTLARQDAEYPVDAQVKAVLTQPLDALIKWAENRPELHAIAQQYGELAQAGTQRLLPGPTGERNTDADAARACCAWRITRRMRWCSWQPQRQRAVRCCGRKMLCIATSPNSCQSGLGPHSLCEGRCPADPAV